MPSRLKSLDLHGYKTFASRAEFVFAEAVTAIVGPNGSGKSNIADSLRWVLGEQSFSLLRGKRTEDMIFSGSEQRPRAGMASATVVFDNSDGWLPIDFTEVAITRRAYRDGENEYLINNQKVRLRDVGELLARSGLAERTYTIIGQGLVDAALSLKAEERRRLFEEAAGIGLYRSRREEALRRLDATRHNLERVQDIMAELLPRLRSLERQARRAQEYEQVRADLRLLLRDWYGYHWHRAQHELAEAREFARQQELALEQSRQAHAGFDSQLAGFRDRLQGLRARLSAWHRQSAQLHNQRETLSRDRAVAEERARSLVEQRQTGQAELLHLEAETGLHVEQLEAIRREAAELESDQSEARTQVEAARRDLQARQAERAAAEKTLNAARQSLDDLTARQAQLQARLADRQAQAQRQQEALQIAAQAISAAEKDLHTADARLQAAAQMRQQAETSRLAAEQALQAQRHSLVEGEAARKKTQDARSALATEAARLRAQAEVLEQAEHSLVGYSEGARLLLQAAQQARLPGVCGALSNLLDVAAEYETAITAALGDYVDAVILERGAQPEAALDILGGEASRGALLPIDFLIPAAHYPVPAKLGEVEGGVLVAADLVRAAPELRPAVELLLASVWIVRDRAAARQALAGRRGAEFAGLRVVTLSGEVFHASGPIQAGRVGKPGALARPRQRRELSEKLADAERRLAAVDDQLRQVDEALDGLRAEEARLSQALETARQTERSAAATHNQTDLSAEKAHRQLQWQRQQRADLEAEISRGGQETEQISGLLTQLNGQIQAARETLREASAALGRLSLDEAQAQLAHWNTRLAVAERAVENGRARLGERSDVVKRDQSLQAALQTRLGEWQAALEKLDGEQAALRQSEAAVNAEIEALRALIEPAEAELDAVEEQQARLQDSEAQARQALSLAEHRHAQARIAQARKQEALETLRQRVEDDFGLVAFDYSEQVSGPTPLPLAGMVEQLTPVAEIAPDLEENIKRQRAQLRRMGPVNPEAQKEYDEVKERHDFLTVQVADLRDAETGIKEVIAELDVLMQREFRKTFEAVAAEFRQIFTRLFGGGSARLVLTDPDDLTLTGIDIEARLPGRREQGLSLLSGGERSLTAVALVFALLKVSPTPFCVLDEVDAMLDEANVGRFRDLLRELSQRTQFAIITHNRNTVQVADVIYGITMGRDSASQVVSLKLDEVSQIVE
jgi:chromosome segregation protein